jgi:predicted DNA-binding transcriptional regulator AlpA
MLKSKHAQTRRIIIKPAQSCEGKQQAGASAKVRTGRARETGVHVRFLNEFQVAEILNVSVATVRRWRLLGRGPKFLKVAGTLVRYPVEALNPWLASQPAGGELIGQPALQIEAASIRGAR